MAEGASAGLIESILQLPEKFATVATGSPEQAILLALGALITTFAAGVFGLLAAGAVVDLVTGLLPTGGQSRRIR